MQGDIKLSVLRQLCLTLTTLPKERTVWGSHPRPRRSFPCAAPRANASASAPTWLHPASIPRKGDPFFSTAALCPRELRRSRLCDIARLSEALLRELNHRIVARLRFLHQARAHASMLEFGIGERVSFRPPDRGTVRGVIQRYNKKTVTVLADDGARCNVSPLLTDEGG